MVWRFVFAYLSVSGITQQLMNGFGWHFHQRCVPGQVQIHYIIGMIRAPGRTDLQLTLTRVCFGPRKNPLITAEFCSRSLTDWLVSFIINTIPFRDLFSIILFTDSDPDV